MYSFHPHTAYTVRRQHRPGFQTYTTFQAPVQDAFTSSFQPDLILNDDTDEEELLLRAALERKQRERLARQQIRQQLQRQEQERYEALLQQERARQLAIAQAQAQYQARQEAIQRFKRAQWIREQKQQQQETAFIEALVLQQARAAQQQQQKQAEKAAYCRARAQAIANAERQACPSGARPTKDGEDPETLGRLLEVLFFPQQEKRHQPQEENYPCKRRHQSCVPQQLRPQDEKAKRDQAEQEAKAKKALDDQKKATTPQQEFQDALPTILSFVEALFGGDHEPVSKAEAPRASTSASASKDSKNVRDPVSTPAGPSPSSSSPELRATDILRQRQQQQQQQTMTLQQKHSELNMIESALDSFSRDLADVLDDVVTESNKRIALSAEENISKAMLQIDSVESDGDLSVRQRRKELIKKSQDMLDLVDTYKNQQLNTGKKVARSNEAEAETEAKINSQSSSESLVENEAEVVERETAQSEEPADVDPLPTDLSVAYDRDENDEDEVIEPYSITEAPSTPLVVESTTVQDATESSASEDPTHDSRGDARDEDEDEDEEEPSVDGDQEEDDDDEEEEGEKEEAVQERSTTVESVESDESSESSESMHDDYEMVPDF
ncbi:hypothetical protein BGX34_004731 [Mortierella sp. NVP85]|nr:hypothetical protein BGX34_004731 [Mortierella sp. NVP85]